MMMWSSSELGGEWEVDWFLGIDVLGLDFCFCCSRV
jgi:hypothetical protein